MKFAANQNFLSQKPTDSNNDKEKDNANTNSLPNNPSETDISLGCSITLDNNNDVVKQNYSTSQLSDAPEIIGSQIPLQAPLPNFNNQKSFYTQLRTNNEKFLRNIVANKLSVRASDSQTINRQGKLSQRENDQSKHPFSRESNKRSHTKVDPTVPFSLSSHRLVKSLSNINVSLTDKYMRIIPGTNVGYLISALSELFRARTSVKTLTLMRIIAGQLSNSTIDARQRQRLIQLTFVAAEKQAGERIVAFRFHQLERIFQGALKSSKTGPHVIQQSRSLVYQLTKPHKPAPSQTVSDIINEFKKGLLDVQVRQVLHVKEVIKFHMRIVGADVVILAILCVSHKSLIDYYREHISGSI